RDRNPIYAVLEASAINHGGRAHSLTAPNVNAQADLLATAYRQADVDPSTVTYIETHGTGTSLGDPVEINGLKKAFAALHDDRGSSPIPRRCGLGSVKSNMGHLELAAGIAGVMKVLLAMKHGQLPASLHCDQQNPYIDLTESPFYLVKERTPWTRLTTAAGAPVPRRAGVSSFGFGGVNAHVVLAEYLSPVEEQAARSSHDDTRPVIVPLSAKTDERLRAYAESLLSFVATASTADTTLDDLAYTLQVGRDAMDHRLALVVRDFAELRDTLTGFLSGQTRHNVRTGHRKALHRAEQAVMRSEGSPDALGEAHQLAAAWASGAPVDWAQSYGPKRPRRISLPTYPFARERCWIGLPQQRDERNGHEIPRQRAAVDTLYATPEWQDQPLATAGRVGHGHVLLFGASKALATELERTTGLTVETIALDSPSDLAVQRFEAAFLRVKNQMALGGHSAGTLLVVVDGQAAVD
ncbi:MAG: ketoacyl-synthetase C-terminal extension domain-containing protein, partial [Myxococcota bacterium]